MLHRFVALIRCFDQRRLCDVRDDECEHAPPGILLPIVSFNEAVMIEAQAHTSGPVGPAISE